MALFTDDFNRADGALGANWTLDTGSMTISGEALTGGAGENVARATGYTPPNADYSVSAKRTTSTGYLNVTARATTGVNYYLLQQNKATVDTLQLYKRISGWTQLGSNVSLATAANDVIKLVVCGSAIIGYVNGVKKIEATDTAITAVGTGGLRTVEACGVDDFTIDRVYTTTTGLENSDTNLTGHVADNLVRSSDGTLHKFICKTVSSVSIIGHKVSTDAGATWSTLETVDTGAYSIRNVSAAIDSNDNMYVYYASNTAAKTTKRQAQMMRYSKAAGTWTKTIFTALDYDTNFGSVTCDQSNNAYCVWTVATSPTKTMYSIWNGSSWSAAADLSDTSYAQGYDKPTVAVDDAGAVYAFYCGPDAASAGRAVILMRKYTGSWAAAVEISSNAVIRRHPKAVADTAGNIHLTYDDGSPGTTIYYTNTTNHGSSWLAPVTVISDVNGTDIAAVQVATDNSLGIFYGQCDPSYNVQLHYVSVTTAGTLGAVLNINNVGSNGVYDFCILKDPWAKKDTKSFSIPKTGWVCEGYMNPAPGGHKFVQFVPTTFEITAVTSTFIPKVIMF